MGKQNHDDFLTCARAADIADDSILRFIIFATVLQYLQHAVIEFFSYILRPKVMHELLSEDLVTIVYVTSDRFLHETKNKGSN
jgi:hypothetical protein